MPAKDTTVKPRSRLRVEEVVEEEVKPSEKDHVAKAVVHHHKAKDPAASQHVHGTAEKDLDTTTEEVESVDVAEKLDLGNNEDQLEEKVEEEIAPLALESSDEKPSTDTQIVEEEKDVPTNEISEWLQSVRPDNAKEMSKSAGGKGKFVAIALIVLILAALAGGVYYYRSNVGDSEPSDLKKEVTDVKVETSTTPAVTQTPAPTAAVIDLSKYKLQILNGAGVSGEAGKAQSYLQTAGFKSFKTGNAATFNFVATEVSMKKDTPEEVFTKIKSSMESYYTEVKKSDKVLDEKSEFDVVVTVGKRK
jgi:hypothetical protein